MKFLFDVLLECFPLPSMHVAPLPWAPPFILGSHQGHRVMYEPLSITKVAPPTVTRSPPLGPWQGSLGDPSAGLGSAPFP